MKTQHSLNLLIIATLIIVLPFQNTYALGIKPPSINIFEDAIGAITGNDSNPIDKIGETLKKADKKLGLSKASSNLIDKAEEAFKDPTKPLRERANSWYNSLKNNEKALIGGIQRAREGYKEYHRLLRESRLNNNLEKFKKLVNQVQEEKAKLEATYERLEGNIEKANSYLEEINKVAEDPEGYAMDIYHKHAAEYIEIIAENALQYKSWSTYKKMISQEEKGGWVVIWSPSYSWEDFALLVSSAGSYSGYLLEQTIARLKQQLKEIAKNPDSIGLNIETLEKYIVSAGINLLERKKVDLPNLSVIASTASYADWCEIAGAKAKTNEYYRFFVKFRLDIPGRDLNSYVEEQIEKNIPTASSYKVIRDTYEKYHNKIPSEQEIYEGINYLETLKPEGFFASEKVSDIQSYMRNVLDQRMNSFQNAFYKVWNRMPTPDEVKELKRHVGEITPEELIKIEERKKRSRTVNTDFTTGGSNLYYFKKAKNKIYKYAGSPYQWIEISNDTESSARLIATKNDLFVHIPTRKKGVQIYRYAI